MRRTALLVLALLGALNALNACGAPTTTKAAAERLYGLWGKTDETLPPIFLDVRHEASGDVGQVWLSGVSYTLPAVVNDTSVVLARPESSRPAALVGVLRPDGRLRVRVDGAPPVEATLDKGVLVR
jgi:hypothetical protein